MRRVSLLAVLFVLFVGMVGTQTPALSATTVITVISDGSGDSVNIRDGASMDATILTRVQPGTDLQLNSVDVLTSPDGWHWLPVALPDGRSGYIRQDLVSTPHALTPPATSTSANATYTTTSPTVSTWVIRHSAELTTISTDFKSISTAADLLSWPLLSVGCTTLSRHIEAIATIEPIPNRVVAQHFDAAFLHYYRFATECAIAADLQSTQFLQIAIPELKLGTAEMDYVYAAIGVL